MTEITGTSGGDELVGTSDDDVIDGGESGDLLIGLEGDDTLIGGDGNDYFLGGEGTDSYDGGDGTDLLYYTYVNGFDSARFNYDLTIDVAAGTASFAGITETFTSIERFYLGDGSDLFYGSGQDDDVLGLDGDDTLHGGAGNDTLRGAVGNDILYGDDGDDLLEGGNGQDIVYGGDGNDTIVLDEQGNTMLDTLDGGAGFDTLRIRSSIYEYTNTFGGASITGMESIEGFFAEVSNPTPDTETSVRVQFDAVFFQNNNISTVVSNPHDFDNWHFAITVVMGDETTVDLSGLQFDENWNEFTPNGEAGDTITIFGDDSEETIIGSSRNDILFGGGGTDSFAGGDGFDTLTYGDLFGNWPEVLYDDLVVDMAAGTATFAGITETFTGIERIEMGEGNDTFYGTDADDVVYGRGGNDIMHGGAGDDVLYGDSGTNTLYGDEGRDYLVSGGYADTIYGGADDDWIVYESHGSYVADTVDGGDGFDALRFTVITDGSGSDFIGFDSSVTGIEALQADFLDEDRSKVLRLQFDAEFFRNNTITSILSTAHDSDGRHFSIEVFMDDETTVDLSALQFDENWNDFTPNGEVGDSITIYGDDSDETLIGSSRNDFLFGGGGTDTYDGGDGIDTLIYGDLDLVWSDLYLDMLYDDMVVDATAGTASFAGITETFTNIERFHLGFANDTFTGSDADEYVNGENGDDTLYGGGGNDTLDGAIGDDVLYGGDGNDRIDGGYGNDLLEGGSGHDVLIGGDGDDTLVGGDGQDIFFGGAGTDTFDGGEGTDSLYFGAYEDLEDGGQDSDIVVDVTAGTASHNWITETFTSIETFWLANGNDTFVGSNGNDTVYGQTGDDYLSGGDGDDFLGGGSGDDTLVGGAGNDRIAGGMGTDIIDAGAGDDTVSFLSNEGEILDTVDGGDGTDRIQLVWVAQGPGYYSFDSSISGFEEISIVFGAGQQDQRLIFDAEFFRNNSITMIDPWQHEVQGQSVSIEIDMDEEVFLDLSALQFSENWNDFVSNGEVGDTLKIIGDDSSETIIGSEVNAEIDTGGGNDTIYGGLGDDTLIGGAGDDYLSGGFGDDTIFGGEGKDWINDGAGQNTIDAGAGDDIVSFGGDDGEVDDFIDGGDGVDTAQFVAFPANGDYVHVNSSVVGFEVIEGFFATSSADMPAPVLNLQLDAAFFQANQISNIRSNAHNADGSHFNITVLMGDETTVDLSALQFDANWNNYTPYGATGDSLTIIGDDANETIIGTSYSNIIRGGGGDDLLTGGIDMDRFEFFHGDGNDTITNFDPFWDLIILRGFSDAEIDAAYSGRQIEGNDIVLSFSDGDSIRLQNVSSEDFSKNQLVGAPAEPDIPGDTSTDTWIVPGETFSSEIESSADSDWLRFSVGADEYFAIEISAEGNLETTIRDASGNELNLSTTRFQTIYDPVTGNQVLLLKHLPEGDYILDLSAYSSRAYTIDARILEDEFSADTSTTGHIALGDTLESTFAFEGDKDWIRFDGVEGQVLRFSFNTSSSVIDGYGPALYDASGNLVDLPGYLGQNVTTNPATGEQYFTFEVPSTGEYFLRLYGSFSEPGFDASYTVSMSELDDIPADVSTTAILVQPGETILGELEIAGDSDWFAIDVAGPQTIRFLATGDQDSLWTSSLTLTFYDEAGNVIGTGRPEYDGNYDLIGNGFLHADHAGRYYVAVEGGNTNTGFYSLTATPLDYGTPLPTSDGTSIHAGGGIYGSIGTTGLPDGLLATALILTGSNGDLELSVGIIDPVADQQLSSVRLGVDGANVTASSLQSFDGGFAAVYIIADYDTSTSTLMAAFFDESGTQTGEPVVLGGITGTQSGLTQELGVIRNADGSIGITAGINTPDGAQLYLLDVASSGTVQAVTLVASLDGASVSDPTLVLLETGERLVTWIESSATSGLTQHTSFIDPAGSANPGVLAGPDLSFSDRDAVVTSVNGGFAVLRSMGTHYELQLFDLDGTARGGPVSIGTVGGTPGTYDFDVLGMADGTIVTATTGPDGVQISRFDSDGTLLGEATQEYSNWNASRNVHLTALSDTSFSLLFGSGAGYEFQVNTFDLPPVMTRLDGSDGAEHLDGSSLADFIRGFAGDDYLTGLSGDDDLFGGTGNDHILGGDGLDRLIAGGGSDKMLGGKGADTFVLTADGIADTISDFDFREDHIEIVRADGLQGMNDLTITQDGRDVVITGQGLEVRLYDTSAEALHAGHFVFVDDIDDSFIALPEPANTAAEAQSVDKPVVFEDLFPDGLPEPADQAAIHPVLPVDYELDAHDHWVITPGDTPLDPGWFLS